jgi:dedicator of cytokinesis protein 3
MSFHETLMRFFRTNYHDEIQRLPAETISELEEDTSTTGQTTLSRNGYNGTNVNEWPGHHVRSNSISTLGIGSHTATAVVGQAGFTIPPLAFGQVPGAGIPAPPPTPGGSRIFTDNTRMQTPLQRNLARLTRYGMSSITSGPGDRPAQPERTTVTAELDATSQQGSTINVGHNHMNMAPSSSRASVQATARDVASSISAAAKSRISRMGSFSWRRG